MLRLCIVLAMLSGCLPKKDNPRSFGITLVELKMSSESLGALNSSVGAKRPFPAQVEINGRTYRAKINYAGRSTIDDYRKNYDIAFEEKEAFRGRSNLRLSALGVDTSGIRAQIGFHAYKLAGLDTPDIEPAAVYMNDEYKGLYSAIEVIDEEFFDRRGLPPISLYKATTSGATFGKKLLTNPEIGFSIRLRPKNPSDLLELIKLANESDSPENLAAISKLLSLDSYYNYLAASIYLNNWDALRNNFFMIRSEKAKQFNFVPWDLDHMFENLDDSPRSLPKGKALFGRYQLASKIFSYDENKRAYAEVFENFFTELAPSAAFLTYVDEQFDRIKEAYEADRVLMAQGSSVDLQRINLKAAIEDWHKSLQDELNAYKETR